jgi:signal transduction histidine kinase
MAVELLQEHAPPELRRELIRNIAELDQLVDEILLASRLDALSDAAPSMEDLDLTALVAEECAAVDAQLQAQAVSLRGDARLLRRMVRNLLENAKRYGGQTQIVVSLAINAGREIQLDVLDGGPGIPPEERENIFAPFYRLPGASERAGGVGLGLSLVRQIANAHGGSARCVSSEHGGGCFRIALPIP